MKNLNFKYAAAWNFLPFGPEGIELNFSNYGNIVLVKGENRDAKQIDSSINTDEFSISDNGTGKSSLQEIIVYGLFGKTVKRPEKLGVNDVVHNKIGKDCKVEIQWDKYRLVRTRKDNGNNNKNTLRLWESEEGIWDKNTEITQGDMRVTQKRIEEIIGLSYDAFINMCIFTDDQRACFLECDNAKKKEIVENLLSLGVYREWFENAKLLRKEIKQKIETKAKEYQLLLSNKDDALRRLNLTKQKDQEWKKNKNQEILNLEVSLKTKQGRLQNTDTGNALLAFREAQEKIKTINEKLPVLENSKKELEAKLQAVRNKETEQKNEAQNLRDEFNSHSTATKEKVNERKKKEAEIANLEANEPGTKCDKCKGIVDEENISEYVSKLKLEINNINIDIQKDAETAQQIAIKVNDLKSRQQKVSGFIDQLQNKISVVETEMRQLRNDLVQASKVREPKAESDELLVEQQIEELNKQIADKKLELNGRSPFQDIIDNDEQELTKISKTVENKEKEVKELETELPYYDYWISGFGENGIRKWIVDGIIPELNNRINYWLQFLIDNRITLKFDNELNEKIERNPVDGDPYVYYAMSTGQRRRLNLAVSQSFAHIMMTSSGSIPNLIFLDEVSTNVDPLGVQGIYNMITELAEDKQVFVTTHDPDLKRMLAGSDTLKLVHENGFTKKVS